MPDITLAEWARLLEVKAQTVTDQCRAGLPATESKGKGSPRYVNSRAAVDWMVERAVAKVSTPDEGESLAAANLRKARADADLAESKAAEAANAVIPLAEVEALVERVMVIAATQLDGLAGRVAATVAAETDPAVCRRLIFDECRRIRDSMAAEFQARAAMESGEASDSTAAEPNAGPMGGPGEDSPAG